MKKRLFLAIGALGALALASCDSQDEKQINEAIKDKSNDEIIQMVVDANNDEALTETYKDGLKLGGEFKLKSGLNVLDDATSNIAIATGSFDISGDLSAVYNTEGVQATANATVKMKVSQSIVQGITQENNVDLKANATVESLNAEADAYVYAKVSGSASTTKINQEFKYKLKKDDSSSSLDDILSNIDLSDLDITELQAALGSASISVDDGMLLFTWENEALNDAINEEEYSFSTKNLTGKFVLGFDKNFHIKRVNLDVKADEVVADVNYEYIKITNPSVYVNLDVSEGSYSIKSLKNKDTYNYFN